MIPEDPVMLLSYVNMKLRDRYASFDAMCEDLQLDGNELMKKLERIDYTYHVELNQFR